MRSRLFSRAGQNLATGSIRLFSTIASEILKDFHEIKASFVSNDLVGTLMKDKREYKLHHFTWRIDITLDTPSADNTPPHPVFTPEYEHKHNSKRHPETSVYCRGDNRTIDQIRAAGGIKPKGECNNPDAFNAYNLTEHRKNSTQSNFVSATKKMVVAHTFGQTCYGEGKYTVYLMAAKDTMGPYINPKFSYGYPQFVIEEEEHSILGQVDYPNIVGFRECTRISAAHSYFCGNIYVSKAFARQHKKHVEQLIEVQKFPEEVRQSRLKF